MNPWRKRRVALKFLEIPDYLKVLYASNNWLLLLFCPCMPLGKVPVNLLKAGSYKKALELGIDKFGPIPKNCKYECLMNCYIEPATFMKNPMLPIKEFLMKS